MVLVDFVVWFIAILLEHIFPEEIGHSAVPGAIVISAAFGAAATSSSFPNRVWLTGFTGVASTALILSLYAALKGFRLGMAAGGTGTFGDDFGFYRGLRTDVIGHLRNRIRSQLLPSLIAESKSGARSR